jgi:hypothetical protein
MHRFRPIEGRYPWKADGLTVFIRRPILWVYPTLDFKTVTVARGQLRYMRRPGRRLMGFAR